MDYPLTDFKSLIYCFVTYTSFLFILNRIIKIYNWDNYISFLLFFWHSIIFSISILSEFNAIIRSDSYFYFEYETRAFEPIKLLIPGNTFMNEFSNLLRLLGFNYLVVSLFFQCLGAISLIIFYNCINKCILSKNFYLKNSIIIFFMLPSFSYWSSFLSKDTITFISISLFIFYIAYDNKKVLFFSIILLITVRPHLVVFIMIYLQVLYLMEYFLYGNSWIKKIFMIFLFYVFSTIILNLILIASNLDGEIGLNLNIFYIINHILDFMNIMQSSYQDTQQAINETNFILKILKYTFGPVIIKNTLSLELIWLLENIFLIFLTILLLIDFKKKKLTKLFSKKISLFLISIMFLIFLSFTANNYGISMRQKWPYVTLLIFSICYFNLGLKNFFLKTKKTVTKKI